MLKAATSDRKKDTKNAKEKLAKKISLSTIKKSWGHQYPYGGLNSYQIKESFRRRK